MKSRNEKPRRKPTTQIHPDKYAKLVRIALERRLAGDAGCTVYSLVDQVLEQYLGAGSSVGPERNPPKVEAAGSSPAPPVTARIIADDPNEPVVARTGPVTRQAGQVLTGTMAGVRAAEVGIPAGDEPEPPAPVRHEVKLRGAWNGYDEVAGEEYALPIFWVAGRWIDSKDTELPRHVADQLVKLLRGKKISLEGLE